VPIVQNASNSNIQGRIQVLWGLKLIIFFLGGVLFMKRIQN